MSGERSGNSTSMGRQGGRQPQTAVFIDSLHHPYVARLAEIMGERHPELRFLPGERLRRRLLVTPGPVALHLQWIDDLPRRPTARSAMDGMAKLLLYVLVLRLRRVPVIWTVHNPVAKGHRRRVLDVVFRSALVALSTGFVVLNPGAEAIAAKELMRLARRRFLRRVHVVPMPLRLTDHGPPVSRVAARRQLGIAVEGAVIAYLPGSHQADVSASLRDPRRRYELISLRRRSKEVGLIRIDGGWQFRGHAPNGEFGLLVCAADAVVLADARAFASMTLHAAVDLRRPVISPACPAVEELARLGGATTVDSAVSSEAVAGALGRLSEGVSAEAFSAFEAAHADDRVAEALAGVYRQAGVALGDG